MTQLWVHKVRKEKKGWRLRRQWNPPKFLLHILFTRISVRTWSVPRNLQKPSLPCLSLFCSRDSTPPHLPSLLISTRQWTVHRRRNCSLKIFALANNNRFKAHLQEITNSQFNSHKQFSHRGFVDGSQRDFLPELCCVLRCICNILNIKLKCIFDMRWNGNFMFLNKTHNVLS